MYVVKASKICIYHKKKAQKNINDVFETYRIRHDGQPKRQKMDPSSIDP